MTWPEMVVVPGDHPAQQIGRSGRHIGLDHLGDVPEVRVDRRASALGDLQGHERGHARSRAGAGPGPGRTR